MTLLIPPVNAISFYANPIMWSIGQSSMSLKGLALMIDFPVREAIELSPTVS